MRCVCCLKGANDKKSGELCLDSVLGGISTWGACLLSFKVRCHGFIHSRAIKQLLHAPAATTAASKHKNMFVQRISQCKNICPAKYQMFLSLSPSTPAPSPHLLSRLHPLPPSQKNTPGKIYAFQKMGS